MFRKEVGAFFDFRVEFEGREISWWFSDEIGFWFGGGF